MKINNKLADNTIPSLDHINCVSILLTVLLGVVTDMELLTLLFKNGCNTKIKA